MMIVHQMDNSGTLHVAGLGTWRAASDTVLTLRCGSRLWITREGDLDDHVLRVGETLAVRSGDRLWIEPWNAGADSWLRLHPAGQNSPPRHARILQRVRDWAVPLHAVRVATVRAMARARACAVGWYAQVQRAASGRHTHGHRACDRVATCGAMR